MSEFTNDDLKRLKEKHEGNILHSFAGAKEVCEICCLLARLEAAELCQEKCAHRNSNSTGCPYCAAWRKACGRE